MKPKKSLLILAISSLLLTGCTFPFFSQKKAALQVTSTPKATVFLNGQHVGQTPFFDENLKNGEYTLKLVPEDTTGVLPSWETKIKLSPLILTAVNRDIGPTDSDSSGEILSLEPLSIKTNTSLAVISIPDSAVVKIDDQPRGFSPVSLDDVATGEHTIMVSSAGYREKVIKARVTSGHKLTISVQLAKEQIINTLESQNTDQDEDQPEAEPTPTPSPEPDKTTFDASASASTAKKPYVEILDNSIGFLRVRSKPSTSGEELTKAYPGQRLPYLNDQQNGWYKISYATGKTGWVSRGASGEYAKLVE